MRVTPICCWLLVTLVLLTACSHKPLPPCDDKTKTMENLTVEEIHRLSRSMEEQAEEVRAVRKARVLINPAGGSHVHPYFAGVGPITSLTDERGRSQRATGDLTALVGIRCSPSLSYNQRMNLHSRLAGQLKGYDPRLARVLITSESTQVKEINRLADQLQNGKNTSRYRSDLGRLQKSLEPSSF